MDSSFWFGPMNPSLFRSEISGEIYNFPTEILNFRNSIFLNLQDTYKKNNFMFKWLIVFR